MIQSRDEARELFNEKFSYKDITAKDIDKLKELIKEALKTFNNDGFTMTLRSVLKRNIAYDKEGCLKYCYFEVDGSNNGDTPYFRRREAISFNKPDLNGDVFVGFAGWADGENIKPFLWAFWNFSEYLRISRIWQH